uniref:Uncharacterized protein n=1 Tax=Caenorhabditis japonica TaxID=281687 RepID=A0A8R1IU65_CAEJA
MPRLFPFLKKAIPHHPLCIAQSLSLTPSPGLWSVLSAPISEPFFIAALMFINTALLTVALANPLLLVLYPDTKLSSKPTKLLILFISTLPRPSTKSIITSSLVNSPLSVSLPFIPSGFPISSLFALFL